MRNWKYFSATAAALITTLFFSEPLSAEEELAAPDLMSFAHGVLPVSVDTGDAALRTGMTEAVSLIDGNTVGFVLTPRPGTSADVVEIVYALPAPTRFERFAVPNIRETPSPSQTFIRVVEVSGASESADGPYALLARGELSTHSTSGDVTELTLEQDQPDVLWVRVRLWDGISVERDQTFFEFSELIGNGTQHPPPLSDRFSGVWDGRGVDIELMQEGPTVTGCYDRGSLLTGTVDGNVLRAIGHNDAGIESQFIAIVAEDGALHGLRSTNGAPFHPYDGQQSAEAPICLDPEPPTLGCGAIVHGIGFDFDSAVIRPESDAILASLFDGLSHEGDRRIEIIGHSSSEGQADYNRDLSQRRAEAVVAALVALGLEPSRISANGRGEDDPIASNENEAGRSMNRRVEVQCL